MSVEPELRGNLSNVQELTVTVFGIDQVPDSVWEAVHSGERASLRSHVSEADYDRIDEMISWNDPERYKQTRLHPEILVDEGAWQKGQVFKAIQMAVVFRESEKLGGKKRVVGGVITELNSSPSQPDALNNLQRHRLGREFHTFERDGYLGRLERTLKINTPLVLSFLPIIGGRGYVHVRSVFADPEAQEVDWQNNEISGIVLGGLWHALDLRNPRRKLTTYTDPKEPADIELIKVTELLRAKPKPGDKDRPHQGRGFQSGSHFARRQVSVGGAMARIISLPGAEAVQRMHRSEILHGFHSVASAG